MLKRALCALSLVAPQPAVAEVNTVFLSDEGIRLVAHEYGGIMSLTGTPRRIIFDKDGTGMIVTTDDYQEQFTVMADCTVKTPTIAAAGRLGPFGSGFAIRFSEEFELYFPLQQSWVQLVRGSELTFPDQSLPWAKVQHCVLP